MRRIAHLLLSIFTFLPIAYAKPSVCPPEGYIMGYVDWNPYEYLNTKTNRVEGLDIEIVQSIFSHLNCKLSLVEKDWEHLLKQLALGRIDFMSGISKTAERDKFGLYSEAYRNERMMLFFRTEDEAKYKFKSIRDIKGTDFVVGITSAGYLGEEMEMLQKDPAYAKNFLILRDSISFVDLLKAHRMSGFIDDAISTYQEIKQKRLTKKISVYPGIVINSDAVYFFFSKKTVPQEFVNAFNTKLAEIKQNGEYAMIMKKYDPSLIN